MSVVPAAVLAVGDELLRGFTSERNGQLLAEALIDLGVELAEVRVVGDDEERIAAALFELARDHALVFATGGLGPTLDDVTRHAAARAAAVELEVRREALEEVERWWQGRGEMPESNRRQAMLPVGATMLRNAQGTAPGFRMPLGAATLVVLPGPPRELTDMVEREVLPWLRETLTVPDVRRAQFYLFGLSESVFAERVGAWMERGANPEVGVTASRGVLSVRMRSVGDAERGAHERLEELAAAFRERFAEHLFSETDPALEVALVGELVARGLTITTAESCTGGLVASSLCRVPGASAVFTDGFVTYGNDAKVRRLGVPPELLEAHGAVSAEVAAAMAEGARLMTGADLAVAVTGVAGPDGGTEAKPVGTVWFGVATAGGSKTFLSSFPSRSRQWIRDASARRALHLAWRELPGGPPAVRPATGSPR